MEEERTPTTKELTEILAKLGLPGIGEGAIRTFTAEEDGSAYAVWRIDTGSGSCVLKRAKAFELEIYRCFFRDKKPYAPAFYGFCAFGSAEYFLMEDCPGEDLRRCEREKLKKALDALIEMQEEFWQREALYDSALTLEKSLEGIENRGRYLGSKRLEEAYAAFVRIYQTTPRTLCHDDLLPFNLLIGERAVLIDWEYGGLLPYPASFARLIAHGREEEGAFFYMTREDRDFAIQYYYDGLIRKHGIPFAEYRRTLDYFLFYEYCEWVMLGNRYDNRSDERYGYYRRLAEELAAKLLQQGNDPVFQMIEVRETTVNELALVQGLWADGDVMRFVGFPEGLHQTDEEMQGWFRWIESKRPALNHYSIFEDGRYCGESFYEIDAAHQSAALDIKLFSFARGRGIGTAGLSHAIREAFRNGAKTVWVDPNPENGKAIALYERLGFQRSAFPKHLITEGEEPGSVYMELRKDSYQFEGQPRL